MCVFDKSKGDGFVALLTPQGVEDLFGGGGEGGVSLHAHGIEPLDLGICGDDTCLGFEICGICQNGGDAGLEFCRLGDIPERDTR